LSPYEPRAGVEGRLLEQADAQAGHAHAYRVGQQVLRVIQHEGPALSSCAPGLTPQGEHPKPFRLLHGTAIVPRPVVAVNDVHSSGLQLCQGVSRGRKELAEQIGISESVILTWVNMADLFRVRGVGKQYAELLEKAGVDTVKELRNRRADNLVAKLAAANTVGGRKRVRQLPGLKRVQSWIDEAKKLSPAVTY